MMIAKPRDAATLILLRDSAQTGGGVEVLLLERHARSAFLPGVHVFPGGVLEEADYMPEMEALCRELSFEQAHRMMRDVSPPERSLGFLVAAIRETYEEAGILLADGPESRQVSNEQHIVRWAEHRTKVHADPSIFGSLLKDENLKLATDSLFYFAHWITPEASPIRFDARFFVAVAPSSQESSHDGKETVSARWISPQCALEEQKNGMLKLAPPTFCSLAELTGFQRVDEVIASTLWKTIETRYG